MSKSELHSRPEKGQDRSLVGLAEACVERAAGGRVNCGGELACLLAGCSRLCSPPLLSWALPVGKLGKANVSSFVLFLQPFHKAGNDCKMKSLKRKRE